MSKDKKNKIYKLNKLIKSVSYITLSLIFLFSSFMTYSISYAEELTIPDKGTFDDYIAKLYKLNSSSADYDDELEAAKDDYKNRYLMYVDSDYVLGEINQADTPEIYYMYDYGQYYTPTNYDEVPGVDPLPDIVTPITSTADMQAIWNFLRENGFTEIATAGIMGNMISESGCVPCNAEDSYMDSLHLTDEEYTQMVDGGTWTKNGAYDSTEEAFIHDGVGYGIVQFTYWTKKQSLYETAKSRGVSISDLQAQLDALMGQISGMKSGMNEKTTLRDAAEKFLREYENPRTITETTIQERTNNAQSVYNLYATGATGSGAETYYFQGTLPKGFASSLYCGDDKYGKSTMKESGAGPTAIAMVASKLSMYIKPSEVANQSSDYYVKGGGSKLDILLDVEKYNLKVSQIGKNTDKLDKALKEGKVAIAVTGSKECGGVTGLFNRCSEQNFIVIFGYDEYGYLICADPDGLNYTNVESQCITLQYLKGEAVGGFFIYEPLTN